MPPKNNKKKRRNKGKKEKRASATAANPPSAPPLQQNEEEEEVTVGERLFVEALMQDPDQLGSFVTSLMETGMSPEDAMSEIMRGLEFRENGPQDVAAFTDKDKKCNREDCNEEGEFLCTKCKCMYYCGPDCQRLAWRTEGHKQECKLLLKCREVKSMPLEVALGDFTTLGVVRTKNHGNHVFAMEQYTQVGDETNRMVPLASVSFEGDSPTYADVTTCLINAILYPEFDTKTAGARRPCFVSIKSESFGSMHVAEHLAAVCHRLGITVKSMGSDSDDEPNDDRWEPSWFCVQQGWNDEISDERFLSMIDESRRHPVPLNGSVRKELLPRLEEYNKRALAVASSLPNYSALRDQVMRLPYEQGDSSAFRGRTTGIVVRQGILFIVSFPKGALLHQQPVFLDVTYHRPSSDVVLGALYKTLLHQKHRPVMIHLGQPSICSHQDVETYENALDKSIVKSSCSLAALGKLEESVERLIPLWRQMGIELLIDKPVS